MKLEVVGYRISGIILFLVLLLTVVIAEDSEQVRRLIQNTGILAFVLLAAAALISPIVKLSTRSTVKKAGPEIRRCLGVSATFTAIVHLSIIFFSDYVSDLFTLITEPQFRNGTAAFLMLIILSISSFPILRKFFKVSDWKSLHRLLYIALPIALLHWVNSPGYSSVDRWISLILFSSVIILRLLSLGRNKLKSSTAS